MMHREMVNYNRIKGFHQMMDNGTLYQKLPTLITSGYILPLYHIVSFR